MVRCQKQVKVAKETYRLPFPWGRNLLFLFWSSVGLLTVSPTHLCPNANNFQLRINHFVSWEDLGQNLPRVEGWGRSTPRTNHLVIKFLVRLPNVSPRKSSLWFLVGNCLSIFQCSHMYRKFSVVDAFCLVYFYLLNTPLPSRGSLKGFSGEAVTKTFYVGYAYS